MGHLRWPPIRLRRTYPKGSVSHDSQVATAPLRIVFAYHPYSGGQNKPLYAFLQTTDSGLSLSYELLKEKFNKSIFPAGAAFFTVLFFFR